MDPKGAPWDGGGSKLAPASHVPAACPPFSRRPGRACWRSTSRTCALRCGGRRHRPAPRPCGRSEEHTSELQSLMRTSYAVFCLKNKKPQTTHKLTKTKTKD